jgi:hypothetical protein
MLEEAIAEVDRESFDFYRCNRCGRLITKLEEIAAFTPGHPMEGRICPCGSTHYRPANMAWWDWIWPRVWRFAWFRWRGLA